MISGFVNICTGKTKTKTKKQGIKVVRAGRLADAEPSLATFTVELFSARPQPAASTEVRRAGECPAKVADASLQRQWGEQ